jgi:hypothetical protein
LGLLLTVTMTTPFQMWLGFGVLLGLSAGLTALQLSAVISSRWFTARRGLVVGLLNGAIATGTLLFMPSEPGCRSVGGGGSHWCPRLLDCS